MHIPTPSFKRDGLKPALTQTLGKILNIDINTLISAISLIVAIGTAFAAQYYFKQSEHKRDEDLIQNALASISRFRVDATAIKRERKKTGLPMEEHEHELFKRTDFLLSQATPLEKILLTILSSQKRLDPEIRSSGLSFIASLNNLSIELQMVSTKLQNFNNNRVGELHKLQSLLERLERKQ